MVGIIWKSFDSMDGENATGWASVKPCYRGENWQRCNAYGVRIVRQGTNWWPCALRCAWNDRSRPSRPSRCRSQTFSNHLGPSQTFFITFIVLLTDNWWPCAAEARAGLHTMFFIVFIASPQILQILWNIWKHYGNIWRLAGRLRPSVSNTAVNQHGIDDNAFCGACEVNQTRGNSEEKRQRRKPSKVKSLKSLSFNAWNLMNFASQTKNAKKDLTKVDLRLVDLRLRTHHIRTARANRSSSGQFQLQ